MMGIGQIHNDDDATSSYNTGVSTVVLTNE